jgi:Ca-activated chloride channel family protein
VQLVVSVTDSDDRPWAGLGWENFKIYENDRPQAIASFDKTDEPISVGIILDHSGSMALKLNPARQAILRFMKSSNQQDEYFVVGFNDRAELIQDFTNSVESIQSRLATVRPEGRTALFDALDLGLAEMKEASYARRALVVVSDGADNHSNVSEGKLRAQLRRADVQIYTIGMFYPYTTTPQEHANQWLLHELSEESGGRLYNADDLEGISGQLYLMDNLDETAERISTELRYQYVIGYQPSDPTLDGKWRKVKVKINPSPGLPQLTVHARTGYYAPLQ